MKQIKDQKLDELIAVLRKRKLTRTFIYSRFRHIFVKKYAQVLKEARDKKVKEYRKYLAGFKLRLTLRALVKKRYGVGKDEHGEKARKSCLKPVFELYSKIINRED